MPKSHLGLTDHGRTFWVGFCQPVSSRPSRLLRVVGVLGLSLLLAACSSRSGGGGSGVPPATSGVSAHPGGDGTALWVRLKPFSREDGPNLAWIPPTGQSVGDALLLHPPRTVEGYHWSWSLEGSIPVWIDERPKETPPESLAAPSWTSLGEIDLADLSASELASRFRAARAIGFRLDESQPPLYKRWPAVVGLGNASSAALILTSLSPVTPQTPSAPMGFEVEGENLELVSPATSCGPLCVRYGSALEAYDSPFFLRKSNASVFDEMDPSGLRLLAFSLEQAAAENPDSSDSAVQLCEASWRQTLGDVGDLFDLLKQVWGTPAVVSSGFDVYFAHLVGGATYQGLEHSAATLIALSGACESEGSRAALSTLMAHELVHVWNVKHLFPAEHATFSLDSYDETRTTQLYFYEGFTEGFAVIGLSQREALTPERILRLWNAKLPGLQSAFSGRASTDVAALNVSDPDNAFAQYNTGASFLLYLAIKLWNERGADEAPSLFWSILEDLRKRVDAGKIASSLEAPPWQWRAWSGLVTSPPADRAQGYTSDDVIAVLSERYASLPGTGGGIVGLTQGDFEAQLSAYAGATGLGFNPSGTPILTLGSALSGGQLPWPFGPAASPTAFSVSDTSP